jgi:hypothetical protein
MPGDIHALTYLNHFLQEKLAAFDDSARFARKLHELGAEYEGGLLLAAARYQNLLAIKDLTPIELAERSAAIERQTGISLVMASADENLGPTIKARLGVLQGKLDGSQIE